LHEIYTLLGWKPASTAHYDKIITRANFPIRKVILKLKGPICQEHHFGPKEFTLGFGSKVWKNERP
jgi:hypothetical protein